MTLLLLKSWQENIPMISLPHHLVDILQMLWVENVLVEELDPVIFFTIDTMDVGDISVPFESRTDDGKLAYKLIYYKEKIPPSSRKFRVRLPKV